MLAVGAHIWQDPTRYLLVCAQQDPAYLEPTGAAFGGDPGIGQGQEVLNQRCEHAHTHPHIDTAEIMRIAGLAL